MFRNFASDLSRRPQGRRQLQRIHTAIPTARSEANAGATDSSLQNLSDARLQSESTPALARMAQSYAVMRGSPLLPEHAAQPSTQTDFAGEQESLRGSVPAQHRFPYTEDQLDRPLEDILFNRMCGVPATTDVIYTWLSPSVTQDPHLAVALAQRPAPPSAAGVLELSKDTKKVVKAGLTSKLLSVFAVAAGTYYVVFAD